MQREGWRREWVIDWQWAKDTYERGATVHEVAEHYGIPPHIIRSNLKRLGVESHRRGRRRGPARGLQAGRFADCDWADAIARFKAGEPLRSIAETMGCSHETVRIQLRRRGIPTGAEVI